MGQPVRGPGGRFAGWTGGGSGAGRPGGLRGVRARARLRVALRTLKKRQAIAEKTGKAGALRRLARAQRAVATHRKEVARVERRGVQKVTIARTKPREGISLRLRRESRVDKAHLRLSREQSSAQRLSTKTGTGYSAARAQSARKIGRLKRALANRQKELARLK